MNDTNIIIRNAHKKDYWEIAGLHIYQYTIGNRLISEHWQNRMRFYYDKLRFFADLEEGKVFVADVNGRIAGFISITDNWPVFKRKVLFSIRSASIILSLALFQYGLNPRFVRWIYSAIIRFVASSFRMVSNNNSRPKNADAKEGDGYDLKKLPLITPPNARWINLIVNTCFRGRGIGRRLLKVAMRYWIENGHDKCGCTVHVDMEPVLKLYKSLGLKVEGRWMTSYGMCLVVAKEL